MWTLDFETEAIVGNPLINPPKPVGIAFIDPEGNKGYATEELMLTMCQKAWGSGLPLLFQNAPFDLSVARTHLGLEFPDWSLIHDTMYLLYLDDPHAISLGLKESAERVLGIPPEEQQELRDWVVGNVPLATAKNWGAYISKAPEALVGKYAVGDVERTLALFAQLHPKAPREPYNLERELMPILVEGTVHGIRVNRPLLEQARVGAETALQLAEQHIFNALGCPPFALSSGAELARALDQADAVTGWALTPTGKKSTSRANLIKHIRDVKVLNLLNYHSVMSTCLGTFIEPWLEKSALDGRLHPNWNQVRQPRGRDSKGTRTGRLSSDDPNFQNVPTPFDMDIHEELMELPEMRKFILPEEGHLWLSRDFSGQEMRILAHFEDGTLAEAYRKDPDLDPHSMVQQLIHDMVGKLFKRKSIKETGFGMIYGMGPSALAGRLAITTQEAKALQDAYKVAIPGVGKLQAITKQRGRNKEAIRTSGGRVYHAEEPKVIKGQYRSFEYKLLNYLIQGSAADQTKQCIVDWHKGRSAEAIFMATVHDEINLSSPVESAKENMQWLRECMDQPLFDVPFRSDCAAGPSWGELEEQDWDA